MSTVTRNLRVTDVAHHSGVARQAMAGLLNAKVVLSFKIAIRFEKAFAGKADSLPGMSSAHDLAEARRHTSDIHVTRLERISAC